MEVRIETAFGNLAIVKATVENIDGSEYISFPIQSPPGYAFHDAFMHIQINNKGEVRYLNSLIEEHSNEKNYGKDFFGPVELDYIELRGDYVRCHYILKEGKGYRCCAGNILRLYELDICKNKYGKFVNNEWRDNAGQHTAHCYYYTFEEIKADIVW